MRVFLQILLVLFLLALAGVGGAAWWVNHELTTPRQHQVKEFVTVPDGATTDQTLKILTSNGIIGDVLPLKLYIKFKHAGPFIKAGYYKFASPITPIAVLEKLEAGQQGANRLTVIEGWTKWDIANAIAAHPSFQITKEQALVLLNDTKLIKDIDPAADSLEGYIFPDTYFFGSSTTPEELIARMVDRFRGVWSGDLANKAKDLKLNCHSAVTMASIIETESKLKDERPVVASVIYNRLGKGIPLGMDSTIVYASKLVGAWKNDGKVYLSDVERKSPYNTRKVTGLPPGPVGSPGVASLSAAVNPSTTNYIYYVRNPDRNDGAHNFYTDAAGFEVGVQALRKWEARQAKLAVKPANPANSVSPRQPKPGQANPAHSSKPSQSKPAQKPVQTKPAQSKPGKSKPGKSKPAQSKPPQSKSSQSKPSQSRRTSAGKATQTKTKQKSATNFKKQKPASGLQKSKRK